MTGGGMCHRLFMEMHLFTENELMNICYMVVMVCTKNKHKKTTLNPLHAPKKINNKNK